MPFQLKEKLEHFWTSTQRILTVSRKPDGNEFKNMARITAVGLTILGILGFLVELVSFLLRSGV